MLRIDEPFHGAVMNHRVGVRSAEGLKIVVRGQAPLDAPVTVNGAIARREGSFFSTELTLTQARTEIVALCRGEAGTLQHVVRVLWDRHSQPRYRFGIDDNVFFLRDIAQKKCASLFDCHYLKGLRELHQRYGTKFVLNVFYQTEGFDISQFPDRYRGEWQDNADWLKLAFHAYAEFPDRPYQYAPPEKLLADMDLVNEQVVRFAGADTCVLPTIIHWGMTHPSAYAPMAARGIRCLSGYSMKCDGYYDINYFLSPRRSEYLWRHDAIMDFDNGIVHSRIDLICNSTPLEKVVPTLERLAADANTAEVMDILTHEQYFWPFYFNYVPDHFQRCEAAIRWLTEHNYQPVFFHEGFLGGPQPE